MICVICQNKEAVVHYAEVVDGEIKKLDLCEQCAIDKGFGMELSFSMGNLVGSVAGPEAVTEKKVVCPNCGMAFDEYRKSGRLGCGECYDTFQEMLLPILEQIHRATMHKGKIPSKNFNDHQKQQKIEQLEGELQEAIAKEAFESAAQLRDEIKQLKDMGS